MAVGVFGKLPDQRDYVQHGMDPALMALVDPWIQSCLQRSREDLQDTWLVAYLNAPIWRFWLGPSIIGRTVLGALMPSVDGVGRYFPLMLSAVNDQPFDAPEIEPQDDWFSQAEELLLGALAEDGTYRGLLDGIANLRPPVPGNTDWQPSSDARTALKNHRRTRQQDFYGPLSFWWSPPASTDEGPTRTHMWRGLPPPQEYAMLLAVESTEQPMQSGGGVEC